MLLEVLDKHFLVLALFGGLTAPVTPTWLRLAVLATRNLKHYLSKKINSYELRSYGQNISNRREVNFNKSEKGGR